VRHVYTTVVLVGWLEYFILFSSFGFVTTVELDRGWTTHSWIALKYRLFLRNGNVEVGRECNIDFCPNSLLSTKDFLGLKRKLYRLIISLEP
jgi:hypothetical protein